MIKLEAAIRIALDAHTGKFYGPEPYILHPLRVMMRFADPEAQIVGVLHDVLEDCPERWTLERLAQEGCAPEILASLDLLTRRYPWNYLSYIDGLADNSLACRVKLADIDDHLGHPETLGGRRERYETARARLFYFLAQFAQQEEVS